MSKVSERLPSFWCDIVAYLCESTLKWTSNGSCWNTGDDDRVIMIASNDENHVGPAYFRPDKSLYQMRELWDAAARDFQAVRKVEKYGEEGVRISYTHKGIKTINGFAQHPKSVLAYSFVDIMALKAYMEKRLQLK